MNDNYQVTMNEGYFCLFVKAKMRIFLNYGGAGGAGRITPQFEQDPISALLKSCTKTKFCQLYDDSRYFFFNFILRRHVKIHTLELVNTFQNSCNKKPIYFKGVNPTHVVDFYAMCEVNLFTKF